MYLMRCLSVCRNSLKRIWIFQFRTSKYYVDTAKGSKYPFLYLNNVTILDSCLRVQFQENSMSKLYLSTLADLSLYNPIRQRQMTIYRLDLMSLFQEL